MPAIAVTDHWVGYGLLEFYDAANKEWIKPILWVEAYLSHNISHKNKDSKTFHLVLLAKDLEWYKNIMSLISVAHLEWFYRKPRIDFDLLKKYSKWLIWLSACEWWEIPQMIKNNEPASKIKEKIDFYEEIFWKWNFYLEIQPRLDEDYPSYKQIVKTIIELHKNHNYPLVATNDFHYINKSDKDAHDILLCIKIWKNVYDKDRMSYKWLFHITSEDEMVSSFKDMWIEESIIQKAIENTNKIMNDCNVELELRKLLLFPKYELPPKYTQLHEKFTNTNFNS